MSNHSNGLFVDVRGGTILAAVAMSIALTVTATTAWPQQQLRIQVDPAPQSAPAQAAPPVAEQAPPVSAPANPGLVEEIGKLLKNSASGLTSTLAGPQRAIESLNSSAKDATDSLKQIGPLSSQTMVGGRALCPPAPNGAPDCKIASDRLCKEKGYKEGKSVDIESAQKCSAKAYFAGNGACRTENFVTRAVCQ